MRHPRRMRQASSGPGLHWYRCGRKSVRFCVVQARMVAAKRATNEQRRQPSMQRRCDMNFSPGRSAHGKRVVISAEQASGSDKGSTLLPMLVWGLILITVGGVILMFFV